jgi:hypothetical protein
MLNRLSFNQDRLLPLCPQLRAHTLDHRVKLVVADVSKRALDHEFLRQRAGNQAGKFNGVARAQYLDNGSPVLFPLTLKVSEEPGVEFVANTRWAAATNAVSGLKHSAHGKNSTSRDLGAGLLA